MSCRDIRAIWCSRSNLIAPALGTKQQIYLIQVVCNLNAITFCHIAYWYQPGLALNRNLNTPPHPTPGVYKNAPRWYISLLPASKYKFTKLMSKVGLASSVGLLGDSFGLRHIGLPLQFPARPTSTYPHPPPMLKWVPCVRLHTVLLKRFLKLVNGPKPAYLTFHLLWKFGQQWEIGNGG